MDYCHRAHQKATDSASFVKIKNKTLTQLGKRRLTLFEWSTRNVIHGAIWLKVKGENNTLPACL